MMRSSRFPDEMQTRQSLSLNLIEPELLLTFSVFLFCFFAVFTYHRESSSSSAARRNVMIKQVNVLLLIEEVNSTEKNQKSSFNRAAIIITLHFFSSSYCYFSSIHRGITERAFTQFYQSTVLTKSLEFLRIRKKKFFIVRHSSNFRELHTKSRFLSLL